MSYIIRTRVAKIEEKKRLVRTSKEGVETWESMGWFVLFEGSWEFLHVGFTKPGLRVEQAVNIRIEPDGT